MQDGLEGVIGEVSEGGEGLDEVGAQAPCACACASAPTAPPTTPPPSARAHQTLQTQEMTNHQQLQQITH